MFKDQKFFRFKFPKKRRCRINLLSMAHPMERLYIRNQVLSKTCPFLRHSEYSQPFSLLHRFLSVSPYLAAKPSQGHQNKGLVGTDHSYAYWRSSHDLNTTFLNSTLFKHLLVWALKLNFSFKNNILINSLTTVYYIYIYIYIYIW